MTLVTKLSFVFESKTFSSYGARITLHYTFFEQKASNFYDKFRLTQRKPIYQNKLLKSLLSMINIEIVFFYRTLVKKNTSFYIPSIEEVKEFFENDLEADKYFNYYSSKGWVVGNKSPMKDWKAAARNWKMNAGKFSSGSKQDAKSSVSRLHVDQNKDYSIPL